MIWNTFRIALREIRRNLSRAFLTVLGIIIGVAAVITMVTLGQGTTQAVKNQISNLGSNLLVLHPASSFGSRAGSSGTPGFTEKDVEAVAEQVSGVASVTPVARSTMSTIWLQKARNTQITGASPAFFQIQKWSLTDGRFFNEQDLRAGRAVCVIGATVVRELFGEENPVGARLRLGTASCEVIGVLAPKGQGGMGDQDDTIVVPLTTLQRRLVGRTSDRDINQLNISAEDNYDTNILIKDVTKLMRERRNLQPNEDNNFGIFDTRQIADTLSSSTKMLTMLLSAVAGVSLLVGGIGIMNIMLVSVTERTREIGIRMAIGARAQEVLWQFLVEAVTLAAIGGVVGIILAYGLCVGLGKVIMVPVEFNVKINVIAFLFSAGVGVLFGFMPARRAAALDPIDALRHE